MDEEEESTIVCRHKKETNVQSGILFSSNSKVSISTSLRLDLIIDLTYSRLRNSSECIPFAVYTSILCWEIPPDSPKYPQIPKIPLQGTAFNDLTNTSLIRNIVDRTIQPVHIKVHSPTQIVRWVKWDTLLLTIHIMCIP